VTKTKKLRVLREIYASIPDAGCKGLCSAACTTIPISSFEIEQLEQATGRSLPVMTMSLASGTDGLLLGGEIGQPCPLLVMGRCGAYEHRPLICRAFGSSEGLPCGYGCRPAELVSDADQLRNFAKVGSL
jgi:Fe-S-cluster containining protein